MTIDEIKLLDADGIENRVNQIAEEMEKDGADIDALTAEVDAIEERKLELKAKAQKEQELRNKIAAGSGIIIKSNIGGYKVNEAEERAKAFVESGRMSMRALLSTGKIAEPTNVGGVNGLADVASGIVDDVHAIALTGNGAWTAAYKKTEASAADITEGSSIGGTGSTYDYVTINPAHWGVLDSISEQVSKLTPLTYQAEIEKSALTALRAKAASKIVAAVKASALTQKLYSVSIDADYLRTVALGFRAIAGKGNVMLYIAQADLLALGKVRGTNEKKALYEIAFDAGTTTSGTITEGGLAVKFRVLDDLTAGVQLFGQPGTIDMPMWDNYEIKTDMGGEYFDNNLIGIRGQQTANADVVCYHGMQMISQAAES